jgi:hypothetical protein
MTLSDMTTKVYERIDQAIPSFSFTNSESSVAHCGAILYELVGGTTSYLEVGPNRIKLYTINEADSALSFPITHKVKVYP